MGQSFEKSRVCLGFLPAGVLHNRHRTLRDLGSSFRVGRQLEFVNTALERRGLCRYYSSAHGVSLIVVKTDKDQLQENSHQGAGGQAVSTGMWGLFQLELGEWRGGRHTGSVIRES